MGPSCVVGKSIIMQCFHGHEHKNKQHMPNGEHNANSSEL